MNLEMETPMNLKGIHHITAVSGKIQENVNFYSHVLGMRLVKKSVNQDDVSAYHLFYADKNGTPGTDLTFFDWPHIGRNIPGADSISGTALRVGSREALEFWAERLSEHAVSQLLYAQPAGRDLLAFEDPEGQQLFLVNDRHAPMEGTIWPRPDIPESYAIKGLYSTVLTTPAADELIPVLSDILNFEEAARGVWIDDYTPLIVFQTSKQGGPGAEIWLLNQPELNRGRLGAGGVHHTAFRVENGAQQRAWQERLRSLRLHVTKIIDRFWFRSIYFRVSSGILFEIATEGPGFDIDEDPEKLGQKLVLPPFLENRREEIEANLKSIQPS